jgi:hypothetical protein
MVRHLFVVLALVGASFLSSRADASVIFKVIGEVTSTKDLSLYGYVGDGILSEADFLDGILIDTVTVGPEFIPVPEDYSLEPFDSSEPYAVEVDFDITDFLESLPTDTEWVGFSLRESESDGSIVTIEYLVLGTFLSLALQVGVTGAGNVDLTDPTEPVVTGITTGMPQNINNPSGPLETRGVVEFQTVPVPEPGTAVIWLLSGAIAAFARRRWRTVAP